MRDDPIARALEALPDEKISPKLAEDVRRSAKKAFEGEGHFWFRFDRFFMDRLMPAALVVVVAVYAVGFVDFLRRTYPGAEPKTVASAHRTVLGARKG